MRYHDPHQTDSTRIIKVLSASVFCLFSFFWIYWFQTDILTLTQHVLSHQQTHYNRFVGTLVVIVLLGILQFLVSKVVRLRKHSYALTYLPSMLLLAMYSDVYPSQQLFFHHPWWIIAPLVLFVWGIMVWVIYQLYGYDEKNKMNPPIFRQLWINSLELICMMFGVALLGNTNAAQHYQAYVEKNIHNGDLEAALRIGARSQENNERLTMLRAFALSKNGQLSERLFEYPVSGSADNLIPLSPTSREVPLLFTMDEYYKLLGARPVAISEPKRYLEILDKDSLSTRAARDYRLCGLLVDRDIDAFVSLLTTYYGDSLPELPRHFREAMILYCHQQKETKVCFLNIPMEEEWRKFHQLHEAVVNGHGRKDHLFEQYGTSYWYYYYNRH